MPLLNYTTRIPTNKTVGEIQKLLAKAGANAILSEYDNNGEVTAVSFKMSVHNNEIGFRLPVEPDKVLLVLKTQRGVEPRYKTVEHAKRVAWRIVKDWLKLNSLLLKLKWWRQSRYSCHTQSLLMAKPYMRPF